MCLNVYAMFECPKNRCVFVSNYIMLGCIYVPGLKMSVGKDWKNFLWSFTIYCVEIVVVPHGKLQAPFYIFSKMNHFTHQELDVIDWADKKGIFSAIQCLALCLYQLERLNKIKKSLYFDKT